MNASTAGLGPSRQTRWKEIVGAGSASGTSATSAVYGCPGNAGISANISPLRSGGRE